MAHGLDTNHIHKHIDQITSILVAERKEERIHALSVSVF